MSDETISNGTVTVPAPLVVGPESAEFDTSKVVGNAADVNQDVALHISRNEDESEWARIERFVEEKVREEFEKIQGPLSKLEAKVKSLFHPTKW